MLLKTEDQTKMITDISDISATYIFIEKVFTNPNLDCAKCPK